MMATFSPRTDQILLTSKQSSRNGKQVNNVIVHGWAGTSRSATIYTLVTDVNRQASVNYMIQDDWVGGSVPEEYRAWTSGSATYDQQAITFENANSGGAPEWPFSDATVNTLIDMIVDVARRYGKNRIVHGWMPQGSSTLGVIGHREVPSAATACPQSLYPRLTWLADTANAKLASGVLPPDPGNPEPPVAGTTYTVVRGDTLSAIAKKFSTTVAELVALNNIKNPNLIVVGQKLMVPGSNAIVPPEPTPPPTPGTIGVGSRVKLNSAVDYNGKKLAAFVMSNVYVVQELRGDRAVVGPQRTGAVTAAVKLSNLTAA